MNKLPVVLKTLPFLFHFFGGTILLFSVILDFSSYSKQKFTVYREPGTVQGPNSIKRNIYSLPTGARSRTGKVI